jgi:hypothetical protein
MNKKNSNGFLKNKNTVTIIASILIVVVLIVGYNYRVNNAVSMVKVPYAKVEIPEKTEITDGMVDSIDVPRDALRGNIVTSKADIISPQGSVKYYTKVNTMIPAGSLFYYDAITKEEHLPDSSLYMLDEGETLNYITVDLISSYSNSIKPGQYIDIYASLQYNQRNQVARLFKNIKILAVKTADGQNVFEDGVERTPYVIFFGLPEEEDMFLKKIHTINSLGGGKLEDTSVSISQIVLTPIPTGAKDVGESEKLEVRITSEALKSMVDELVLDITKSKSGTDTGGQVNT